MSNETNVDLMEHQQPQNESKLSFDEIDDLTSDKSDVEALKEAKKEVAESQKEEKKEAIPSKSDKKVSEQDLNDKSTRIDKMAEEVEQELVEELKLLKAKRGEQEYEIPEDAMIRIKINGEEQDVSLNDLRNNYSGKIPWDKRYQELSSEKREFLKEKSAVEKYVNEFRSIVEKGDKLGAMEFLASLSGTDPLKFRKELRDQILNNYQQLMQMDENQRLLYEKEEELDFLKRQKESEQKAKEAEQTQMELQTRIAKIQEAHKINDADFVKAYDELLDSYNGEITPEVIGDYISMKNAYNQANTLLSSIDESLLQDAGIMDAVAETIMNDKSLTIQDIEEVIREEFGFQNKKVSSSKKVKGAVKKQEEPQKSVSAKQQNVFSFDDL